MLWQFIVESNQETEDTIMYNPLIRCTDGNSTRNNEQKAKRFGEEVLER